MENLNDAPQAAVEISTPEITIEKTPRGSIDRAFEAAFADAPDTEAKVTSEVEQSSADRDENGRFKGKEATPETVEQTPVKANADAVDVPSRFSPDAKAEWDKTPDPVKAEVRRALTEQENGIKEYQTKFETLKPYEDIAKQAGTTIPAALDNYLNLERTLRENPVEGLQKIFDYVGLSPRDYAAHIMGQAPDAQASQQDHIVRELKAEIASLKQEVTGVTTSIQGQKQAEVLSQIDAFAAANPRFEELSDSITQMLQLQQMRGEQADLAKAYEMADRLNPAPTIAPTSKPDVAAQTRKASLSVTGAPASGSNPTNRMPPSSARNAVDTAFARLGL